MKLSLNFFIATILAFFVLLACQQEKKLTEQQKQIQITEFMKDSLRVNMMMDQIASDYKLQNKMMHKMIDRAKSDRVAMTQIGKMMIDDMEMRSMFEKMTGEKMMGKDTVLTNDFLKKVK